MAVIGLVPGDRYGYFSCYFVNLQQKMKKVINFEQLVRHEVWKLYKQMTTEHTTPWTFQYSESFKEQ